MKELPKKINKSKAVALYSDQYNSLDVLTEIRSIQENLGIPITKGILSNEVKKALFKRFGLPTGYELTDNAKMNDYEEA